MRPRAPSPYCDASPTLCSRRGPPPQTRIGERRAVRCDTLGDRREEPGARRRSTRRGASLRARPRPHRFRLDRDGRAGHQHDAGPARRGARLPALLGRRAPRDAGHRELVARGADRPPGGRHGPHPRRLGRCDVAQPPAARRRRAVRHARRAAPRPDRPRHRPRSRHGPAHRPGPAPRHGPAGRRRLPRAARRAAGLLPRRRAGRGRPRAGSGPGGLAARVERLQRPARGAHGPAVRLRPPLQQREHAARARALPADVPPVRRARRAVRPDRRVGAVRPGRRGGAAARAAVGAAVPPAAPRAARPGADAGRGGRLPLHRRRSATSSRSASPARSSAPRRPCGRA